MMHSPYAPTVRTTVDLDDDVLRAARALASARRASLGRVLSDLARRGLRPAEPASRRGRFPVFEVPADAPPLTPDLVARALDEDG
jgi:hypothetical protein